jgi:hypothetical protein
LPDRRRPDRGLAERFGVVAIEPGKTSIYIGSVTLTLQPLVRHDQDYSAAYSATVFPYFFYDEGGRVTIRVPDDALRRVSRGEAVDFTGSGVSDAGAVRKIEGRATPTGPEAGRIKVRIYVSKRIALIFNTTYQIHAAPTPKRETQ